MLFCKLLVTILLFLSSTVVSGQARGRDTFLPGQKSERDKIRFLSGRGLWDVGFLAGSAHSLTDISGRPDWDVRFFVYDTQWTSTNMNAGVYTRYHYSQYLAFTLEYSTSRLSAADSLGHRKGRGLAFTNLIFEGALMAEYYPLGVFFRFPLYPYGFFGIAAFYNNPKVFYQGEAVNDLDPFGRLQPAIPMGVGINYMFGNSMKLGAAIGWRKLFTNYLDGLNTSINSKNDSYYFITLRVSYRLDLLW